MSTQANAIAELISRSEASPVGVRVESVEQALDAVAAAADRPAILREYRALLLSAEPESVAAPSGTAGADLHRVGINLVRRLTEILLARHPDGPGSEDRVALVAMVRDKTHALAVFREIALGHERPAEIRRDTGLEDAQVHRVLSWGVRLGLLIRWETPHGVHYRMSTLGHIALQGTDEPAWLSVAAGVVRILMRDHHRLGADNFEQWAEQVSAVTGLTREQSRRTVDVLRKALRAVPTPRLARMLRARNEGRLLYVPPLIGEGSRLLVRAEAMVFRSLERGGISAEQVDELSPEAGAELADVAPRLAQHTALCVSATPFVRELLRRCGDPVGITDQMLAVRWEGSHMTEEYALGERDFAAIIQLLHPAGTSQVIIAGLTPRSTFAACRVFAETAESLLAEMDGRSSAIVLAIPRGEGVPPGALQVSKALPLQMREPDPPPRPDPVERGVATDVAPHSVADWGERPFAPAEQKIWKSGR